MDASVCAFGGQSLRRRLSARFLCVTIVAGALACAAPTAGHAEEPKLPSVGGNNDENLSVGIYWGLYEQWESQDPARIGIVGSPMPFVMGLMDSGENRLFIFVQHRVPGGTYCAETPAQLEDLSVDLTAAGGDPTMPGPEYSKTYIWTPTEAGEYTLCAYLDAAATDHPAAINFVKLTADTAPGGLSFTIAPEADSPESSSVKVEGTAVVPSELASSVQEQGLSCTLPEGQLAGQQLFELSSSADMGSSNPGVVGPGPFTTFYTFAAPKPGPYEVCAYLIPAPTEKMYFRRPYEIGSADFSVQEAPAAPVSDKQVIIPAPPKVSPPSLSGVGMSNDRFRVAGRAYSTRRTPVGTKFRFAVSAPATVTIAITRLLPGVLRGRSCEVLRGAHVAVRARRCNRGVAVGSIVRRRAAGDGVIQFSGVLGHGELVAGLYSAVVTARTDTGRSAPVELRFSVAP
jgi:hypothetical protein